MSQRGTTLLEIVIVAAIGVLIAASFFTWPRGARTFAASSGAAQFDAALAYAKALAANSGNGATLVFGKRIAGDGAVLGGFTLTIYAGRPSGAGAMQIAQVPPMQFTADVTEAKTGGVPFTIFLNGAGHASAIATAVTPGTVIAADPGCPAGETALVVTLSDPRASAARTLACNAPVSGAATAVPSASP